MTARRRIVVVSCACLCLTVARAQAQQPSVSAPAPPPPIVAGSAELSFVTTSGNTSTQSVGLSGDVVYRPGAWVLDNKASFVRNEATHVVSAKSFTALSRLSRDFRPGLSAFGQYDFQRNLFSGIVARQTVTAGISYQIVDSGPHLLRLDGGAGYANERQVGSPSLSTATMLGGAFYRLKMSATSEVSEDARLFASLSHIRDRRFDQTLAVTAKMTALLSLKASYVLHYVHAPAPGFRRTDTIVSAALVLKF
jgi:putative salt-induced outer membrane protein